MNNKFFNAHHSPVGAFSSFTLGYKGKNGGLGINLGAPAEQNIFIGAGIDGNYKFLPFYEVAEQNIEDFTEEKTFKDAEIGYTNYKDDEITRDFNLGTDSFITPDFKLDLVTPHFSIPEDISSEEFKLAITPSIVARITITNPNDSDMKVVMGKELNSRTGSLRHIEADTYIGLADGTETMFSTSDKDTVSSVHFTLKDLLDKDWIECPVNRKFMLGQCGALITNVKAGETKVIEYVVSFYQSGKVTSGIITEMAYTHLFHDIEDVAKYSHINISHFNKEARTQDEWLNNQTLNEYKKFQIAHSIKSYYGSTQLLLDESKKPIFIVNEGEYRMMHTFDLAVDHLFYELYKNPWVVKSSLQLYIDRYFYFDKLRDKDGNTFDGGISFTHDFGNVNQFTPQGRSSYELTNLSGCFSYMTYEQLTNFIICAVTYCKKIGDIEFAKEIKETIDQTYISLLRRDHADSEKRNGIMSLDSSKVGRGDEITTYDSLDVSLGQARHNTYLASKTYASYALLKEYYADYNDIDKMNELEKQMSLLSNTISDNLTDEGLVSAVLFEDNNSHIIPIIEGLSYLKYLGLEEYYDENGKFGRYITTLKTHTNNIMNDKKCLFENGGYKLSSTSTMTWLSKIYIAQYLHEGMFDIDDAISLQADKIHVKWLTDEKLSYWSWSDQILNEKIKGSKYYPRGVTSILWTL